MSCPTRGLEFDPQTLDLIDTDKDGHIRVPEIIAAVKWAGSLLKNPDDLLKESAELPLQAINDDSPEGAQILASARQILVNLGKSDAQSISLNDTADTARIFAQTKLNGDGIVPADATDDASLKSVIQNIIDCLGAETDRSGKPGVNQAKADQFFADAQAYYAWQQKALQDKSILPLGDATAAAAATVKSLAKINDYLRPLSPRRLRFPRPQPPSTARRRNSSPSPPKTSPSPPAKSPDSRLPASNRTRPCRSRKASIPPGPPPSPPSRPPSLNRSSAIDPPSRKPTGSNPAGEVRPYETWAAAKAGATVEKLGPARLQEILASPTRNRSMRSSPG